MSVIKRIRDIIVGSSRGSGPQPHVSNRVSLERRADAGCCDELSWVTDLEAPTKPKRRLHRLYEVLNEAGPVVTLRFPCNRVFSLQTARRPESQDMGTSKGA